MLAHRDFLLEEKPHLVDFDLWGMLANYLYSGSYKLPSALPQIQQWYERLSKIKFTDVQREKLHT